MCSGVWGLFLKKGGEEDQGSEKPGEGECAGDEKEGGEKDHRGNLVGFLV
jgi:hypothetical protein